jgi:hypothetical protein
MFSVDERERLRATLLEAARADRRISGGAVTGSVAMGKEDRWSDIDLAFGVAERAPMDAVITDWTARMYEDHHAVHHVDVTSGSWIYRVFLLHNTLQVDLAFAPAAEFGARAPTFRLVFGSAGQATAARLRTAEELIGFAWLYALHARSSIRRGKPWQAEYMVSALRDHVLALACVQRGLPASEGRGIDLLPAEVTVPLEAALVSGLKRRSCRGRSRSAWAR